MRWIGIDEAGYGPNIGPLVMTAVVAEAQAPSGLEGATHRPDLWKDLEGRVDRAAGNPACLWVDDSKAILRGGKGRKQLEMACIAAVHSAGGAIPASLAGLLSAIGAGSPDDAEVSPWLESEDLESRWPWTTPLRRLRNGWPIARSSRPGGDGESRRSRRSSSDRRGSMRSSWRPARRPTSISRPSRRLVVRAWDRASDGRTTFVTGDKHGGRHYYLEPLSRTFPDAWIDRGPERPESSRYTSVTVRDSWN